MGRRTLAQELADLATTAPTQELDLERDELGGGAVLVETDDELDELPSRSGKLAGLRLRGDIELPEQAYSGRKTTRSAAFQSSESEGDEEELEEEDAEAAGGDDQQSAGKDEPEEAGITQADDRHAKGQAGYVQEMENLERQYDAVQAVDEAMLAKVRQRGEADRKKGRAVKHQRTIWDKVLEMRILLQRCTANLFKGAKKRKLVDRRASKGRKLRYHVQEKLVNFMAPVQAETPAVTMQLFSNLFGRATA
ncbi:hypothetical protein WJX72_007880 [[Myrmecia] bisecta]|uniref:Apoptosis-antagonizing transcription factor C-terminal domain-containing protein n=1 Tax=[Myrmecia] bisecta TaxID=41462 RepID=A0AAW1PBK0_9CHLO